MSSPHHLGSEVAEKTGGGKIGGRCSEATVLEEKRQEKAFEQAMIESPMDGIYEAQAAAESESLLFQTRSADQILVEYLVGSCFLLSHPKIDDRSEHYQHQILQLKKDKVKARRKRGRRPGLGQQEARQDQQPQIPTEREMPSW